MIIHLKGEYTILGSIWCASEEKKFQFRVPFENSNDVIVNLLPSVERNKSKIEAFHDYEVTEEMWEVLQSGEHEGRNLSESLQEELSKMSEEILFATRRVLNLIKYNMNQYEIDDNLFSRNGTFWSTDKANWERVPMILGGIFQVESLIHLDKNSAQNIQEYIDNNRKPYFYFAFKFLHKAKKENHPHYKWINATIAAELAIKEFLSNEKLGLNLGPLLMEIPSPPISKLYGKILKSYAKEQSPKRKSIIKGEEKRNLLIHRPSVVKISQEEAIKYVRDVEIAIYHLLNLLFPDDVLISYIYERV